MNRRIRLATRAIIVQDARLLLVNAWPGGVSDLWCAPGGGVEPGASLPDNLIREVAEETGLQVAPGPLALVNEFHDPQSSLHQVDLYFRCRIVGGSLDPAHRDPEGVVTERRYFSAAELGTIRLKPDSLPAIAFDAWGATARYDPLEEIVR
ncbi:NUDIX domain-containing protein [Frigidibacter sp. ROC022]|uniref:NUDIX domain-containing protein n=1 Tax=Frigidibacter sp. ROC022 TaxID=2971796 RepID=UPI00215A9AC0|nr:NUDIX domain-containing protein [Frigidibacter sp. ROC022]MCR8726750.1 NUDIX domain-containing protein [Frigidibacter sp. ROC022]